jgi:leucyl aminopeptidase (aminopeptidase T)
MVTITPREVGGIDPPPVAAAAIKTADVIISESSYAIIHTETIREALRHGARLCEMWGVTEDMLVHGGVTADYVEVRRLSYLLKDILTSGKQAHATTRAGTDISFSIQGREAHVLAALANKPGMFCAFPDGEAAIAPIEGTARGTLVNPISMEKADIGFVKENISFKVEQGKVVGIEGGIVANELSKFLEPLGDNGKNIAELGIGTNPRARLGVTIKETKKAWGTIHIALGDSKSLGGLVESPLHMDMIFREPTLTVDNQVLIKDGKVIV